VIERKAYQQETMCSKGKVLLVCIAPDVKSKLVHNINELSNFIVSAEVDSFEATFDTFESQQFSLVIVDTSMRDRSYDGLVKKMRLRCPHLPVLAIPVKQFPNK
jgi:DNA-binding NarL/FixJ family response regulator